ncbi:GNAT family N-acetyltransferase [Alicyclobacillus dauci]|uniref:GNAT family N-acetyltransferase n=1 Tax=Alicyclobacillus dauci TaxID=1475485 RepID=A0ABY6YXF1_9BACL|nr:GNAT family N-acetyltransferase [Alicyclobacillus dauci]WAH35280.1 GNAT family N-acetyltransferase [Alicyclobacillus dauci]
MVVRDAVIEDLPYLLEIYNQAVRNSAATFDLEESSLEQRKVWFSHYSDSHPLIVCEVDGVVAGYASLSRFRDKAAYDKTVESSVYVDEAFHGQGIGKTLMREILQRAREIGHHVVIAGITGGNEASIKLHVSLGFEYIGCFKEVGFKFGRWQDVHFYQLLLS